MIRTVNMISDPDNGLAAFTSACDSETHELLSTVQVRTDGKQKYFVAKWDTGATCTCISHRLFELMAPKLIGTGKVYTASGADTLELYNIHVILPGGIVFPNIKAYKVRTDNQRFDLLIGMDIIGIGDFSVSNDNGNTVFSFRYPSQGIIDYTI